MKNLKKNTTKNKIEFSTINEMLDFKYGKIGTPERDRFNKEAEIFLNSNIKVNKNDKI
jgi:hypothetical protein